MKQWSKDCALVALLILVAGPAQSQEKKEPSNEGRPLSAWVKQLHAGQGPERIAAAKAMAAMGPEAKDAVPDLIEALRPKVPELHLEVIAALGKIGAPAVPALINALQDRDYDLRRNAARALGKVGIPAVPPLLEAAKDKNDNVRRLAIFALGEAGPLTKDVVATIVAAHKDSEGHVRAAAVTAMGKMGAEAKVVVSLLLESLKDKDPSFRELAAAALGEIGPPAKEAVPLLNDALKDSEGRVRVKAVVALSRIGAEGKTVLPLLIGLLKDKDFQTRNEAATALGAMGPEAKEAVPDLVDAFKHVRVQKQVGLEALAKLGVGTKELVPILLDDVRKAKPKNPALINGMGGFIRDSIGPSAVPALINALKDEEAWVRQCAANALTGLGYQAKDAIPALADLLKDKDENTRIQAVHALGAIVVRRKIPEIKTAVPTLAEALQDSSTTVRLYSARALSSIGPDAKAATPALVAALKANEGNIGMRNACIEALGQIGPEAKEALPALIAALSIPTSSEEAVRAIVRIGPVGEVAPLLIEVLKNKKSPARSQAAWGLGVLKPVVKEAIPVLIEAGREEADPTQRSPNVPQACANALGRIGMPALPVLIACLKDKDPAGRQLAAQAILLIGPEAKEAVPALIEVLKEEPPNFKVNVHYPTEMPPVALTFTATALSRIGPAAVPALADLLKDKDPVQRRRAAAVLRLFGPGAKEATGALAAALKDEVAEVRLQAVLALSSIGPEAKAAVPGLFEACNDKDLLLAQQAGLALIRAAGQPAILEALRNEKAAIRSGAILAYGGIQPPGAVSPENYALLLDALKDRDAIVRRNTAITLAQFPLESVRSVPALMERLKDPEPSVVAAAIQSLGQFRNGARAAEPALMEILKGKERRHHADALRALSNISQTPPTLAPLLIESFKDGDDAVRLAVLELLPRHKPNTKDVTPILLEGLKSKDPQIRTRAARAVHHITPPRPVEAIPSLIELLKDEHLPARTEAVLALGMFDSLAKAAIPALTDAFKQEKGDSQFRRDVEAALYRIDPNEAKRLRSKP